MKLRTGYLIAAGVILAAAITVWYAKRSQSRLDDQAVADRATAPKPAEKIPEQISVEFGGLQLKDFDEDGNLRWRVASEGRIDFDQKAMLARGTDIRWELGRGEDGVLSLMAPEFVADYANESISLSKGVKATSDAKDIDFESSAVTYDMTAERLVAAGPLTAIFGDYSLEAAELSFERASDQAELSGPVKCTYRDYILTAGKAILDRAKDWLTLTGKPSVRRGEYSGRAEKMEIDGQSQKVAMSGGVTLKRGTVTATAPKASLDKAAEKARMSGGVRLDADGMSAKGRELAIDGSASTATLTGGVRCDLKLGG